ncbi:SMP-30/gluconolactonase/LRE family protein [Phaeobacter sp. LSS9]|uniref:SMP-30/gluconolactonase/LRE family protein n=1 Tax=Phaeobacter sp. LSS9 TaxID=681157 RepID=UPI000E4C86CB|nr:SMP-30/gluconolactonase/LRE family protein [Phaeobacter sp. LSS9]AXT36836.1 SMP-30/gluconolactonase/LRE family protein [Phaeobacter sp. LSS9]
MRAELVVDCINQHGEGIFWNPADGLVWWTDIEGCTLWSFDPSTLKSASRKMAERVCCFAPRASGGLIVAYADRVVLFDPDTGEESLVTEFESGNPETRLNDGRTDRQGRLIVGGMNEVSGKADSSVICIDTDLKVRTIIEGVSCANSTCFSPDGATMFFADTPDREIVAFDYDTASGSVSSRRQHASFKEEPGLPDGSCVDAEGGVWNAEWEGHRVVRVAPDGTIDRVIDVPVWKPTCCTFGGTDLDTLFITTSRLMSGEEDLTKEPESGGLFAVKPGICGVIDAPFNG